MTIAKARFDVSIGATPLFRYWPTADSSRDAIVVREERLAAVTTVGGQQAPGRLENECHAYQHSGRYIVHLRPLRALAAFQKQGQYRAPVAWLSRTRNLDDFLRGCWSIKQRELVRVRQKNTR